MSRLWILAILPILMIPFENHFSFFGLSLAKLTIIPLLLAIVMLRPIRLFAMWNHPAFLFGVVFLIWGGICEALHPNSDWEFLFRIFQMFVFATLVGTTVSDAIIFRRLAIAIIFVSAVLAFYLIFNYYGSVNIATNDFREANKLRAEAFEDMSLELNLNMLGYTVGMGAVVALARLLSSKGTASRFLWGGAYVLCALGATVTLSRGALFALVGTSGMVLWRNLAKLMTPGKVFLAFTVLVLVVSLLPEAMTSRLTSFQDEEAARQGKADARMLVLTAAAKSFPEYWAVGVGAGHFWKKWAARHGFERVRNGVVQVRGPHNGFLAAWIYFGLPGVVLLGLVCFVAARQCPKADSTSWEALALFGLLVLGFLWIMFAHNIYMKELGIILGLLMGASRGALQGRSN